MTTDDIVFVGILFAQKKFTASNSVEIVQLQGVYLCTRTCQCTDAIRTTAMMSMIMMMIAYKLSLLPRTAMRIIIMNAERKTHFRHSIRSVRQRLVSYVTIALSQRLAWL